MKVRSLKPTTSNQQLATVFFLLSCPALAYDFAGGTGEPNDPYQIATAGQLTSIGSDPNLLRSHFVLIDDIDLDPNLPGGRVFDRAVIASDLDESQGGFQGTPFSGCFDGSGHTIKNLIVDSISQYAGLFGFVSGDGWIINVRMIGGSVRGDVYPDRWGSTGALAGENQGFLRDCQCDMTVDGTECTGGLVGVNQGTIEMSGFSGTVRGGREIGGLIGINSGSIKYCASSGIVKGNGNVGGFIGYNNGKVECSFFDGDVIGERITGGLIGCNEGKIIDCYAKGKVDGVSYACGGLVGMCHAGSLRNSLALTQVLTSTSLPVNSVGGLLGKGYHDAVTGCYALDPTDGGGPDNSFGFFLTSSQMQQRDIFWEWDFSGSSIDGWKDAWTISEQGHPVLTWQTDTKLKAVPKLTGLAGETAGILIERAGYIKGQILYDYHAEVPDGSVIRATGPVYVNTGSLIDILVSLGPYDWNSNPGEGTDEKPFQIGTPGQLLCLGQSPELYDRSFVLTRDIDLTGYEFSDSVIAASNDDEPWTFEGRLDGQGHRIYGLCIQAGRVWQNIGLFGQTAQSAEITRLGLDGIAIHCNEQESVGCLVGYNEGRISNCYVTSFIVSASRATAGGLVGENTGSLMCCYTVGVLSGYGHHFGGLVGSNNKGGIRESYCIATVFNHEFTPRGRNGDREVETSVTHWLVEKNSGSIDSCYYQIPLPIIDDNGMGTPLSPDEMRLASSFEGWDFYGNESDGSEDCWFMHEDSAPILVWESEVNGITVVPRVAGLSIEQARSQIVERGFIPGIIELDYHENLSPGATITAKPAYYASLGSAVNLVVSRGPYDWSTNPGTGSPAAPFQITTAGQLESLANHPEFYDRCFALMNNLDFQGREYQHALVAPHLRWVQAGFEETAFMGTFNGNGNSVINFTIYPRDGNHGYLGLFGFIDAAGCVHDLHVENARIIANASSSHGGALAGSSHGEIRGCRARGAMVFARSAQYIGGLVGDNQGVIRTSSAEVLLDVGFDKRSIPLLATSAAQATEGRLYRGPRPPDAWKVGGLTGYNSGYISDCYAKGAIQLDGHGRQIGGLIGWNQGIVMNCYATGAVNDPWAASEHGGLMGSNDATVLASYFLHPSDGGGPDNGAGGVPLPDQQMRERLSFKEWDFVGQVDDGMNGIWQFPKKGAYPDLNPARAAYVPHPFAGSGTSSDPYLVETIDDLDAVFTIPQAHYKLITDLDLNALQRTVPRIPVFGGDFDGGGHKIGNMCLESDGISGLFGTVNNDAVIRNLVVAHARASNTGSIGLLAGLSRGAIQNCHVLDAVLLGPKDSSGGFTGMNEGIILDCSAVGVHIEGGSSDRLGAFAGYNTGTISRCCATGSVRGGNAIGGCIGFNDGTLANCFARVSVEGQSLIGGFVGHAYGGDIEHCYSSGAVHGQESVGGFVGDLYSGALQFCYSIGPVNGQEKTGGLVGYRNRGVVSNCVWDMESSQQDTSQGGIGLSTVQMVELSYFGLNGWANDPNWVQDVGHDYPHLAWEGTSGKPIPVPTIHWMDGSGTLTDPFRITRAAQLVTISKTPVLWDKQLILDTHIDLNDITWPGSVIKRFNGTLNGNGYAIRNLAIEGDTYLGLIGILESGGHISNLRIEHANVAGAGDYVGILIGSSSGDIENCQSTGTVSGRQQVGGLIGQHANGTVVSCSSTVTISAESDIGGLLGSSNGGSIINSHTVGTINGGATVGGLLGRLNSGNVTGCYSISTISGSGNTGGLVGQSSGKIIQSYCHGTVTGRRNIGGLVAYNHWGHIESCFSTCAVSGEQNVAGLVGENSRSSILNCFSDVQAATTNTVFNPSPYAPGTITNVQGLSTAEMQTALPFLEDGWDFDKTWMICEGKDYPRLQWEQVGCDE